MDNMEWIDEVVKLYFKGYTVKEAIEAVKNNRKKCEGKRLEDKHYETK